MLHTSDARCVRELDPVSTLGYILRHLMMLCPHCGWENPKEAAFCTNCGRGLGRARASRVASLEEALSDARPDAGRRFRALDVGASAKPAVRTPPIPEDALLPPPLPSSAPEGASLEPDATIPMFSPPGASMAADTGTPTGASGKGARTRRADRVSEPTLIDFRPPVQLLAAAQAMSRPPAPPSGVHDRVREALVDSDDEIEIPEDLGDESLSGLLGFDLDLNERGIAGLDDPDVEHSIPGVDHVDEVELGGGRPDGPGADEDVEEISTSDLDALEPHLLDDILQSDELEALRPLGGRIPPPPLQKVPGPVRFLLRPLSTQVSASKLVLVGDEGISIGRSQGGLRVDTDQFLSPLHARFSIVDGELFVEDLDSLNGTWLRVSTQAELHHGDIFKVGQQVMRVDANEGRDSPSPATDDGTRRFGAPSPGSFRVVQLGDDGSDRNVLFVQDDGCRIGRQIGDLVFTTDTYMSGTHALIAPRGQALILRDLSSRNGSWVKLKARTRLKLGDALMTGESVWRVGRAIS